MAMLSGKGSRPPKKELSPEAKKQAYLLIVNSVILLFLYFAAASIYIPIVSVAVPILYWVAFGAFLIAYLIYNRGFTRKGLTVDMLPPTWTKQEKEDYLAAAKMRQDKSRWMLTVIIPLLVTIAADAIYLFTYPLIQNLFK